MTDPRLRGRRALLTGLLTAAVASSTVGRRATAAVPATRWLSGAADPNAALVATGAFGRWRGDASTYARVWADESLPTMAGVWMMRDYTSAGWTGTLDIACGGPRDGQTWQSAASGGMDATWQATCRSVHAHWGKLSAVHLSMAHELNGDWYPWSVNGLNLTSFKQAWARWHRIVRAELVAKGRDVRVCLSLNADTLSDIGVQQLTPDPRLFDLVGCDFYSAYPDLDSESVWNAHRRSRTADGSPRGVEAWFDYARSLGKPLSFPEWGLDPARRSDNPYFVRRMHTTFAENAGPDPHRPTAGRLAGEAYFNESATCRIWPDTQVPRAAATYRSLSWGR